MFLYNYLYSAAFLFITSSIFLSDGVAFTLSVSLDFESFRFEALLIASANAFSVLLCSFSSIFCCCVCAVEGLADLLSTLPNVVVTVFCLAEFEELAECLGRS